MPDLDLAYLSATDALSMFRARTLSPVELLDALIDRIESVDVTINAVVDRRYDEARVEAKASADRYAGGGEPLPLDGLPVAAKEEHPMAGRSWRQGSHVLADVVAEVDHPIIERIPRAGGIVHIRTATPEFCCAGFCHTTMWGITRNPWNPDWSRRRLVGRLGCCPGGRIRPTGHRFGHRRVDPHPVVAQRRGRLQATVRPSAGTAAVQPRPVLSRRPDGPLGRRPGVDRERRRRTALARHRIAAVPADDPCCGRVGRRPARRGVLPIGRLATGARGRVEHPPCRPVVGRRWRDRRRGRAAVDPRSDLAGRAGSFHRDHGCGHRCGRGRARPSAERLHAGVRQVGHQ